MFFVSENKVSLRKFDKEDIENKVKWINDSENNTYLHYDLPLEYEKTVLWYERIKSLTTRIDAVIEYIVEKFIDSRLEKKELMEK